MARLKIRNAGGVPFLVLRGHVVVRPGQLPDGDTLAFAASARYSAGAVATNVPVGRDGRRTVNIRLQSIDAPEKSQPLGAAARDRLLRHFGFVPTALGLGPDDFTANGALVQQPAWLATHGLDGNARPLGYLFRRPPGFAHGAVVSAQDLLPALKASANLMQVTRGAAFPAFYDNTEEAHAVLFQGAAARARAAQRGVWASDVTTRGFTPTPQALGRDGALVYPKFYRRVCEWASARPDGAAFIRWLKGTHDGRKQVVGAAAQPMRLWQLFEPVGTTQVAVPYDVTKLWFSE